MSVESTAATSLLLMCAICAKCTTPDGNAERTWRSARSVEGSVCRSGSGSTSMFEALMSAGSGRLEGQTRGTVSLLFTRPMSSRSAQWRPTGWLMRRSGVPPSSTTVCIGAIIRPAVTPCICTTELTRTISETQWRRGQIGLRNPTSLMREEKRRDWQSSLSNRYERFGNGTQQVGFLSRDWLMNMAFAKARSATWSIERRGVTSSEVI